jgi:hypothetical protein
MNDDRALSALTAEVRRLDLAAHVARVDPRRAEVRGALFHVTGEIDRLHAALATLGDGAAGGDAWVSLWLAAKSEAPARATRPASPAHR